MMMRYEQLTKHAQVFLSATGLRVDEFDQLLKDVQGRYAQAEYERLSRPNRQRAIGGGQSAALSARDQILMGVVWLRLYPTNEVLGYLFGVSDSTVSRYVQRVVKVLEAAGQDRMRMPDPGRKRRRTLDALLKDTPELVVVIDSFEQKVQRPAQAAARDALYSGKKKTHTLKSQVCVDEQTGQIVDVSESQPGPLADIKVLEASSVLERLPSGVGAIGDCGYQGIHDLHPLAHSPRKKPRGKARPPEDVAYNTAFSRRRIIVENSIGRMRRYQAITQTDRHHRQLHAARVRAVAGLANRQIAHRLPH
jgi:hypothetical protein